MKKSLKLIALMLALVALVSLSACKKDEETTPATTETPTTTEAKTAASDLVGTWRFDASELDDEKFSALCVSLAGSITNGSDALNDLMTKVVKRDTVGKLFNSMALRFYEDGTYAMVVSPEDFADGYEALINSIFEAMGEMSIEDAAAMNGVSAAELEASLNGATWKDYCVQSGQVTAATLKSTMTADGIADMLGGKVGEDGFIVSGDSQKYDFDGETLTLGNCSIKVTIKDGELTFDSVSGTVNDNYKELVESGCKLVKEK